MEAPVPDNKIFASRFSKTIVSLTLHIQIPCAISSSHKDGRKKYRFDSVSSKYSRSKVKYLHYKEQKRERDSLLASI